MTFWRDHFWAALFMTCGLVAVVGTGGPWAFAGWALGWLSCVVALVLDGALASTREQERDA